MGETLDVMHAALASVRVLLADRGDETVGCVRFRQTADMVYWDRLSVSPSARAAGAHTAELSVRLAVARGDTFAAHRALLALRSLAPTPAEAIGRENRLRRELGLPMLPLLAFDDLHATRP